MIKLGPLSLPDSVVTETIGLLAGRGAGKTNTARALAEGFFDAGMHFVAIDPVGSWWGLRSNRAGKGPGLALPIFGGRHGDVPLEREGGELVADLIVEHRLSCVLDLTGFDSEASKKRFLLDFARRLYAKNEEPLHLFLEEADDYIPQRPMRDEAQLLRAWENIVRRGRARGLGMTMITQRSASISKSVLTQVQTLIAMRTTGPQDRAAIAEWLKYNDQDRDVLASLPKLKNGEAWVWSPNFLETTKRVQFPLSRTFDSGATPKAGARKAAATLADVDLAAIEKRMAATVEKVKAEDPKLLKRRIAELERELAKKPEPDFREVRVEIPVFDKAALAAMAAMAKEGRELVAAIAALEKVARNLGERTWATEEHVIAELKRLQEAADRPETERGRFGFGPPEKHVRAVINPPKHTNGGLKLAAGERRVLTVLAQYDAASKRKVALLSGYAVGGGGFNNTLSALRTAGRIVGTSELRITEQGRAALGDFDPLPTSRAELLEHWYGQLGRAERSALEVLAKAYPKRLSKSELAEAAGYQADGGGFNNALSRLRTLELVAGRGELVLADEIGGAP